MRKHQATKKDIILIFFMYKCKLVIVKLLKKEQVASVIDEENWSDKTTRPVACPILERPCSSD